MSETLNNSIRKCNSEKKTRVDKNWVVGAMTATWPWIVGKDLLTRMWAMRSTEYTGCFPTTTLSYSTAALGGVLEAFFSGWTKQLTITKAFVFCLPGLMNLGKDFATQVGGKIQPTSRIATVHDSQHTIVDNAGTGCSSYIVSDTPHVFNIRPIARDSVGHSANPQQLLQQDLWIGLREDTGLFLTTGVETIKDTDDNPTNYHATISFVHRYYVAFFF